MKKSRQGKQNKTGVPAWLKVWICHCMCCSSMDQYFINDNLWLLYLTVCMLDSRLCSICWPRYNIHLLVTNSHSAPGRKKLGLDSCYNLVRVVHKASWWLLGHWVLASFQGNVMKHCEIDLWWVSFPDMRSRNIPDQCMKHWWNVETLMKHWDNDETLWDWPEMG